MGGAKNVDVSSIVLPANASWIDHAVLYVLKDPQNFFGWLAEAITHATLMISTSLQAPLRRPHAPTRPAHDPPVSTHQLISTLTKHQVARRRAYGRPRRSSACSY